MIKVKPFELKIKSLSTVALIMLVFIMPLFAASAGAAVIKGNIYDFSLNKIGDVIVEIDSAPKQTIVSKDGSYSFTLNPGSYIVSAAQKSGIDVIAKAEEKIDVKSEGEFSVDLILFPVIEQQGVDDISPGVSLNGEANYVPYIFAAGVLVALVTAIIAVVILHKLKSRKRKLTGKLAQQKEKKKDMLSKSKRRKKAAEAERVEKAENQIAAKKDIYDAGEIIEILKRHGGRATQKDIRKEIPFSEAKISLMIAELESKGKLEKIKKGRGNIIILK